MSNEIPEVGKHTLVRGLSPQNGILNNLIKALYQVTKDEEVKKIVNIKECGKNVYLVEKNERCYYIIKVWFVNMEFKMEVVNNLPEIKFGSEIITNPASTKGIVYFQRDKYTDEIEETYQVIWK